MESGPPQQPPWPPPEAPPGPYYPPGGGWQPPAPVFAGLELASWGSRAGATALDGLVLLGVFLVLLVPGFVVLAVTGSNVAGGVLLGVATLIALLLVFLYAPFFMQREGAHNGQTLGKQWVGIRVVRVSGEPMGWGWALLREFVIKGLALSVASGIASTLTFFVFGIGGLGVYLADYLWPLWDDQNRAVHDMIAETRVIRA